MGRQGNSASKMRILMNLSLKSRSLADCPKRQIQGGSPERTEAVEVFVYETDVRRSGGFSEWKLGLGNQELQCSS